MTHEELEVTQKCLDKVIGPEEAHRYKVSAEDMPHNVARRAWEARERAKAEEMTGGEADTQSSAASTAAADGSKDRKRRKQKARQHKRRRR